MNEEIHGIITRGVGGLYTVRADGYGEILCRARGVFRIENITPTVGDDVIISRVGEDYEDIDYGDEEDVRGKKRRGDADVRVDHVIDRIMPRKSLLIRPPLANLDYLFAVIPAASPEPDLLTADKMTVIAENYGIETVVIINKTDISAESADRLADIYSTAGYKVFKVSAQSGDGISDVGEFIASVTANGKTVDGTAAGSHVTGAFAGVSGAGKSTLMSALFAGLNLKTGDVSRKTGRGRHTTRHVELYPVSVDGGTFYLADTPGFSVLDFTRFDFFPYDELSGSFREFDDCIGKCRYTKCTHLREEGCAVLEKMRNGGIAPSRHESYIRIFEEQRSVPEWKRRQ